MKRSWCGVSLLAILWLASCASQTQLPQPVRAAIAARYQGHVMELRQSSYYGDLYDENEKWLLSPYPFAQTSHIDDTHGVPIHPRVQRGIIAAGARFYVDRLEFPDSWAMTTRMLTTPRYNPWVYLRGVSDEAHIPAHAKTFVLVLPLELNDEAAVEDAIGKVLSSDGQTSTWMAKLRPTVRVAVENKDAVIGMNLVELSAAMGDPPRWFNDTHSGRPAQVAWYPDKEIWLVDGSAVDIRASRPAPAATVAPAT